MMGALDIMARLVRRFARGTEGAAATEFAIWVTLLTIPILNAVDVGFYSYQRMQLDTAAQMAAQAIWKTCDTAAKQPVTAGSNCSTYNTVATAAAQSTSLGTSVTIVSGTYAEAWYCGNKRTGQLQVLSNSLTGARPTACSSAGGATVPAGASMSDLASGYPGDYVSFTVRYTYSPLFSGVTITSLLPAQMDKVVSMRVS